MTPSFDNVPAELRARDQWVLWRRENRGGRPCKIPYSLNGKPASTADATTWDDFARVTARFADGGWDGIGYVFAADDPFCGVDLDGCRDPETSGIADWAMRWITRFGTYAEVSPSGSGCKIFARGKNPLPAGKNRKLDHPAVCGKTPGVELYDRGRFFAVTGEICPHCPGDIIEAQDAINEFVQKYWPAKRNQPAAAAPQADIADRCWRYLQKMPDSISGQSGHNRVFAAACECFRFGLSDTDAMRVLQRWNAEKTGGDLWSEKELQHKLDSAWNAVHQAGDFACRITHPGASSARILDWNDEIGRVPSHGNGQPAAAAADAPVGGGRKTGPIMTCIADVEPTEVKWLWPGRIPAGRITLLVGRPGEGKSFLTLDAAARVSTGTPWPDGSECPKGSVILISAEDDPSDTIRPRLDAHFADVRRIHLLTAVRHIDADGPYEHMITLADVAAIEQAIQQVRDCRLVVVDPVGSHMGGRTDSHRDNEVRAVLAPIAALAEKYGVAVLVVAHRRKSFGDVADDMALGSRAFTGIARAVWHLTRDRENKSRRLLLPGKNNLAREGDGLAFSIIGDPPRLSWERDPIAMTADDALAEENQARSRRKPGPAAEVMDGAAHWLSTALAAGPRAVKELYDEWRNGEGGSRRTLERAKTSLGVIAYRETNPGPWLWRLSEHTAKLPKNEQLGDLGGVPKNKGILPNFDPETEQTAKLPHLGGVLPDPDRVRIVI